jgi:transposase
MHYISGENRNQYIMTSYEEMIPANSDIRKLETMINKIYSDCEGSVNWAGEGSIGRKAYHPKDLLKLLLYGYLNSIQSSRKLEEACHINLEVKWLLSGLAPDFKTIASFRRLNGELFHEVSKRFQQIMYEHCFIDGKLVALDSVKVKANASRDYLKKKDIEERIAKSEQQIGKYLSLLEQNDLQGEATDDITGKTPEQIRAFIDALEKQKAELERYLDITKTNDLNYLHPTDVEAVILKTKEGKVPGYNVQTVVDSKSGMITAIEAERTHNDLNSLGTMLNAVESNLGIEPETLVADTGYGNVELLQKVEEEHDTEVFVSMPASSSQRNESDFTYHEAEDVYICKAGKRLCRTRKNPKKQKNRLVYVYQCFECAGCAYAPSCHKSKIGRSYTRYVDGDWEKGFRSKMQNPRSAQLLKRRKAIVEHVFGTFRVWMGKIPLLLRGKRLVQAEMDLYALSYNLMRWINLGGTLVSPKNSNAGLMRLYNPVKILDFSYFCLIGATYWTKLRDFYGYLAIYVTSKQKSDYPCSCR